MADYYSTNRRGFLRISAAGLAAASSGIGLSAQSAGSSAPVLRLETDPQRCLIPFLSWDTEGGKRAASNLLRAPGIGLRVLSEGQWLDGTDFPVAVERAEGRTRYRMEAARSGFLLWAVTASGSGLEMTFSAEGDLRQPFRLEMVVPFDPQVTPTTVLPAGWNADRTFEAPLVISAPDFGQMLVRATPGGIKGRLRGNRHLHRVDLHIELPPLRSGDKLTLQFTPAFLPAPAGLADPAIWQLARRGWVNAFQATAEWGEPGASSGAPAGVLANNVISDPCSFATIFYADHVLWTPQIAEGVSVAPLLRRTVDFWLNERTRSNGEVTGYTDYYNFLDANAGPLIEAWDYVEATGDLTWLENVISQLEAVGEFSARRDVDQDGLVEATQTGNAYGLKSPMDRSSNWFDAVNFGHKDAYANAFLYRGWRCLADLEARLHRDEKRARFAQLADRLKAAYARALYNPQTGWIACWRSADSALHDYASPVVNGLAIEYGLVPPDLGRKILDRLWAKVASVGFTRFDLGLPSTLVPVLRSDYLPHGFGCPQREDGTDSFQHYQNGGISAGRMQHFLAASYLTGQAERADRVLKAMLGRQQAGGFQNGVRDELPKGMEWTTWDGQSCGYEGYLGDNYTFLLSALLREPAFRQRFYRPLA